MKTDSLFFMCAANPLDDALDDLKADKATLKAFSKFCGSSSVVAQRICEPTDYMFEDSAG